jgi:hypothetical protein
MKLPLGKIDTALDTALDKVSTWGSGIATLAGIFIWLWTNAHWLLVFLFPFFAVLLFRRLKTPLKWQIVAGVIGVIASAVAAFILPHSKPVDALATIGKEVHETHEAVVGRIGMQIIDTGYKQRNGKIISEFVLGSKSNEHFGDYSVHLEFDALYEEARHSFRQPPGTFHTMIGKSPERVSDPKNKLIYSIRGTGLEGWQIVISCVSDRQLHVKHSNLNP